MTDEDFGCELANRLNGLVHQSPGVCRAVAAVFRARVELGPSPIGDALIEHPTIQVFSAAPHCAQLGPLGILNGLLSPSAPLILQSTWDEETGELTGFRAVTR